MSTKHVLSVEEAIAMLLDTVKAPDRHVTLPLLDGLGRVLAEDIAAVTDQPPFDRSPLDGYAVSHNDIASASEKTPVALRVAQTIYAGDFPAAPLFTGEAARIMTGAPLPDGATCVIRQEDTARSGETVHIHTPLCKHENYCFRGEDVARGQPLLCKGERLNSASMGILAGQGRNFVRVYPQPTVYILPTGNELLAAGMPPQPGKIFDSNYYTLSARAMELGAQVAPSINLDDDPDILAAALTDYRPDCQLIVTTGGVSVGEHDYMPQVGETIGANVLFHGIAAKPGGPALAMEKDSVLILSLSGNPFAAFATFELLAVPALRKISGETAIMPRYAKGRMAEHFSKPSKGRRFLRACIEDGNVFFPGKGHASGILSSLAGCNCLIDIPAGTSPLERGMEVKVILM